MSMNTTEPVKFRLFTMPCCGICICWVNPRLPNFCPECGLRVLLDLRAKPELTLFSDDEAELHLHGDTQLARLSNATYHG